METLEDKKAVLAEAQRYLDETITEDRMTVIVSVKDDDLSVSILNASTLQAVLMLKQAYRDALQKASEIIDAMEQGMASKDRQSH